MRIFVKVKPGAKKQEVVEIDPEHFVVSVTAVPEKGRANLAIISVLAEYFGVRKSAVNIAVGHTTRNKIIEIKKSSKVVEDNLYRKTI